MASKLSVLPEMLTTSVQGSTPFSMFDGNPTTYWFPGWNAAVYPAKIVIDLKMIYNIEKLRFFDGFGAPTVNFYFGKTSPTDATRATISAKLDLWQAWREVPVASDARYITVELASVDGNAPLGELEIYGTPITDPGTGGGGGGGNPVPPTVSTITGAAAVINTCGFHWVPTDVTEIFSMDRIYTMWSWFEATKGINRFEPTDGGAGNYDTHLAALKAKGIKPIFVANTLPDWMKLPTDAVWDFEYKPKLTSANGLDPLSYKDFARFCFQVAARYGKTKVADTALTINSTPRWTNDPPNVKKSGLGLLDYFEVWNEPDKWWKGPNAQMSPAEYAALLSACYDGHEGRLGAGYGVRTADPTMKVVMAGLANIDMAYVDGMTTWFQQNRTDKRFCADVLNFHHYSNENESGQASGLIMGISPEANNLRAKIKAAVDWRNKAVALNGKELWLTEYGYDTNSTSQQRPKLYGTMTLEDLQAMWLVRSSLEIIAGGFDKAFIFNAIDEPANQGLFASSGLAQGEAKGFVKKPSWGKMKDLLQKLNGLTFKGEMTGIPKVKAYVFGNATDTKTVIYMWCPTSDGSKVKITHPTLGTITISETPEAFDLTVA
ncbi:MAG: hypothetical protein RLZZ628_2342 [Bacteroidota bacterium]|jgi:hypothetical protein